MVTSSSAASIVWSSDIADYTRTVLDWLPVVLLLLGYWVAGRRLQLREMAEEVG